MFKDNLLTKRKNTDSDPDDCDVNELSITDLQRILSVRERELEQLQGKLEREKDQLENKKDIPAEKIYYIARNQHYGIEYKMLQGQKSQILEEQEKLEKAEKTFATRRRPSGLSGIFKEAEKRWYDETAQKIKRWRENFDSRRGQFYKAVSDYKQRPDSPEDKAAILEQAEIMRVRQMARPTCIYNITEHLEMIKLERAEINEIRRETVNIKYRDACRIDINGEHIVENLRHKKDNIVDQARKIRECQREQQKLVITSRKTQDKIAQLHGLADSEVHVRAGLWALIADIGHCRDRGIEL